MRQIAMVSLVSLLLLALYGIGAWKFWTGFTQTQYSQSKALLTFFWPFLLISASYRQNFRRALKG